MDRVDENAVHGGRAVAQKLLSTDALGRPQFSNSSAHTQKSALTCGDVPSAQNSQGLLRLRLLSQRSSDSPSSPRAEKSEMPGMGLCSRGSRPAAQRPVNTDHRRQESHLHLGRQSCASSRKVQPREGGSVRRLTPDRPPPGDRSGLRALVIPRRESARTRTAVHEKINGRRGPPGRTQDLPRSRSRKVWDEVPG